ncbi:MAG: response regulator [bacterium]|nr:response regulator [bacterium]
MDIEKSFKAIEKKQFSEGDRGPVILIVEDDDDSFDILSASLRLGELGTLEIRRAGNGLEALKECDRHIPDIILLDILMPEMDGFQFIHEFRRKPGVAGVPVIFISTIDAVGDRIRGLDLGAIDFISKPFNPVEVTLRVGRHLEIRRLMMEIERQRENFSDQAAILDTIFNHVPSGLAVVDRKFRVLHHNKRFASFFPGTSPLAGQEFPDLVCTERGEAGDSSSAQVEGFLAHAFDGKEGPPFPLDLHSDDMSHKEPCHLSLRALPFPHREDCLLLDLWDVTALIEAERRVVLLDRLALLGQISMGVAHEINNPNGFIRLKAHNLETITNALAPVLDDGLEQNRDLKLGRLSVIEMRERQHEAIGGILKATERISAVVERLKSFGRDEKRTLEKVNLREVVETAVQIAEHHLKGIEDVQVSIPEGPLPETKGNQIEFEQILVNLLTNAAQSIEERREVERNGYRGNISICVVPGAGEIGIFVSDNGKGIQEKMKSKIFMPYFTTKERGKGTGLGLSISHELVSKYGGRIEVDGAPMKGATLKVFIPVHVDIHAGNSSE